MSTVYEAVQPYGTETAATSLYAVWADINGLSIDITPTKPVQVLVSLNIGFAVREGADGPVFFAIAVDDVVVAEAFGHYGPGRGYSVFLQSRPGVYVQGKGCSEGCDLYRKPVETPEKPSDGLGSRLKQPIQLGCGGVAEDRGQSFRFHLTSMRDVG